MNTIKTALFIILAFLSLSTVFASDNKPLYVIVTDTDMNNARDGYTEVVKELAASRSPAKIFSLREKSLDAIFAEIKELKPDYIAFVVHFRLLEDNFTGEIFQHITALDDDPYLDSAWGFITGRNAADALSLVRNTAQAEKNRQTIPKKFAAVAHTFAENDLAAFATQNCESYKKYGYETVSINPIDDSDQWEKIADSEIKKLDGSSLIFLAGHGMGDMSCTIPGSKFGQLKLNSAVVVNGTCHSAVTMTRYDSIDQFWTIKTTRINPDKSVCLNFIKAGAVAQLASTASSSWQNVAFAVTKFFDEGKTLGQALTESLNDKIRQAEIKEVKIIAFQNGKKSPQALSDDENPGGIQSIARVVLIGDPAYRPFTHRTAKQTTDENNYANLKPEDIKIKKLIDELSNPEASLYKALNELIKIGSEAVPLLIIEMKTNNNWQIPKALGAIGDKQAIEPLINKLEVANYSPMKEVIAEALTALTDKELGTNVDDWKKWWQEQKTKQDD